MVMRCSNCGEQYYDGHVCKKKKEEERRFPLLIGNHFGNVECDIPWGLIAPHEEQARKNHGQSLERLAQRHGLSFCEAVAIIEDRPWRRMDNAWVKLAVYVLEYEQGQESKNK